MSYQLAYQHKLNEVSTHILQNDLSLAFRKLVDCILDTESKEMYQQCIDIVKWEDTNPNSELIIVKYQWMVEKLSKIPIRKNTSNPLLLDVKNINKQYNNGRFKLENISLQINQGEVWGLVGENGNGKTTLLRILAKDLQYDSGNIDFPHLQSSSRYDLRTHITYLPQRTPKWYGSLMGNLQFTASNYKIFGEENSLIVQMYIIRFGLWKYRFHQWDELSSGYKMRFELVRSFLRRPTLLLLDEPLANLDILSQQLILEDLKHMSKSIANPIGIVLSSQQLYEVEKISDHVLFLKNGAPTMLTSINEHIDQTIIELEVDVTKDKMNEILNHMNLQEIQFNGGIFIVKFNADTSVKTVLNALLSHDVNIKYVRDISNSTRRLF
jgi:ABC-2 type transport system ATP-binding protein